MSLKERRTWLLSKRRVSYLAKKFQKPGLAWSVILCIIGLIAMLVSFYIFFPGFLSPDSIGQYAQALSGHYSDWHPALMAIIWRFLIKVTGTMSSMLFLQLGMLWTSITLLGLYIHRITKSKLYSLIPLLVGICPFVFSISGVIWKDVQLSFSLLLATSLLLFFNYLKPTKQRLVVAIIAVLLIIYAANIRHNVFIAVVPLIVMIGIFLRLSWKRNLLFSVIVLGLLIGTGYLLNAVFDVQKSNVQAAVMVDDIKELNTSSDINNSHLSAFAKSYFNGIIAKCNERGYKTNALFGCGVGSDFTILVQNDYSDVKTLWLKTIKKHPWSYLSFRLKTFERFIAPQAVYIIPHPFVVENNFGLTTANQLPADLTDEYLKISERDFGFGFKAYFWMAFNVVLLIIAVLRYKILKLAKYSIAILSSGLIYILLYLPTAISHDYRYYYWLILSTFVGAVIILSDYYQSKHLKKE
jgi:hypothetical protein